MENAFAVALVHRGVGVAKCRAQRLPCFVRYAHFSPLMFQYARAKTTTLLRALMVSNTESQDPRDDEHGSDGARDGDRGPQDRDRHGWHDPSAGVNRVAGHVGTET